MNTTLYHYGIKGMKWGVRKDPMRSTNGSRSKGSNARKIAIGVGVAAAVAGLTYASIKTGKAQQIARGASRLARMNKTTPLSGYELRKMGISTFEPNRIEIDRGTAVSAARRQFQAKTGRSFSSNNITVPNKKLNGYSNKNYTELGRAYYKNERAQEIYNTKLKVLKKNSELAKKFGDKSFYKGNELKGVRPTSQILMDDVITARTRANRTSGNVQRVVWKANAKHDFRRTRPITFRKLR